MDDHWCTHCDKAINASSNSLYCSEDCLRADALSNHPLLGFDYGELKNFPRSLPPTPTQSPVLPYTLIPWDKLPGLELESVLNTKHITLF